MSGALFATFVRLPGGRTDEIRVERSNGSTTSWRFPTYGGSLPHDLVHLAVEIAFDLRRAFWGTIDTGADPARIHVHAPNRRRADYRGFGVDRTEILFAESLATIHWYDPDAHPSALCEDIAARCRDFGVAHPEAITLARAEAARAALRELRTRFRAAGADGLRLAFSSA